jgi:hypothetical protein
VRVAHARPVTRRMRRVNRWAHAPTGGAPPVRRPWRRVTGGAQAPPGGPHMCGPNNNPETTPMSVNPGFADQSANVNG